jgi:hypothetical protein
MEFAQNVEWIWSPELTWKIAVWNWEKITWMGLSCLH